MKGREKLPMPGFCHQIILRLPHLSLRFIAKATPSPAPSSPNVDTHTLQGFLTTAHLYIACTLFNQEGHLSFFYCIWDNESSRLFIEKGFSPIITVLLSFRKVLLLEGQNKIYCGKKYL